MHAPRGKGIWIQRIAACEGGDVAVIVARARDAGFGHAVVRLSEGAEAANVGPDGGDLAVSLSAALTQVGITVWGWVALFGNAPSHQRGLVGRPFHQLEAEMAVRRVRAARAAGLAGVVIDARVEYERSAQPEAFAEMAGAYLRDQLPDLPLALSSWKSPREHPDFPWYAFRRFTDIDLPHIFWVGQPAEAARQVSAVQGEFDALSPRRLSGAVGSTLWQPQPAELVEFLAQAQALGLEGASLWRWDELGLRGNEPHNRHGLDLRRQWDAVAQFPWPTPTGTADRPPSAPALPLEPIADLPPTLKRFFILLRRGQLGELMRLYAADVAQLAVRQTRYGRDSLADLLKRALADANFDSLAVLGVSAIGGGTGPDPTFDAPPGSASIFIVRWILGAGRPDARSGADTFHLNRKGEIVYHTSALLLAS